MARSGMRSILRTAYATHIPSRATALKREGKSVEDAVATITAELKPGFPDTGRAADAIQAAYDEAL